jgi:hypothetical protein
MPAAAKHAAAGRASGAVTAPANRIPVPIETIPAARFNLPESNAFWLNMEVKAILAPFFNASSAASASRVANIVFYVKDCGISL